MQHQVLSCLLVGYLSIHPTSRHLEYRAPCFNCFSPQLLKCFLAALATFISVPIETFLLGATHVLRMSIKSSCKTLQQIPILWELTSKSSSRDACSDQSLGCCSGYLNPISEHPGLNFRFVYDPRFSLACTLGVPPLPLL